MSSALFWLVVVAVVVTEAAIIITALRMKIAPGAGRGVLGARPVEIVWTLLPALLVVLIVAVSYGEMKNG